MHIRLLFLLLLTSCLASATPPNLIVIMADDLGYQDVGFMGAKHIPTPHIDTIAQNGTTCTSAYVTYPVCGPSRAGFITGRYQQRFGFERNPAFSPTDPDAGLHPNERTLGTTLQLAGYHTGLIGKWHLGAHPNFHPLKRGFHEFFGHLGGGKNYFPKDHSIKSDAHAKNEHQSYRSHINRGYAPVKTTKYLTDAFSDEAVSFITRNRNKPFFLFLSYNAPHGPLQATQQKLNQCAKLPFSNPKRTTYAAMLSSLDDGVGKVITTLKKYDLTEKTLVVFLSDNGGPESQNASSNGPLRGQKSSNYEGGYRIPFAIQWPGHIPAGKKFHKPVSSLDVYATIAALAKAPIRPETPLDGVNLIPYLNGQITEPPHPFIYLRKYDQNKFAIRDHQYKLVIQGGRSRKDFKHAKIELYDLSNDLGERKNQIHAMPEKARQLQRQLNRWTAPLTTPYFEGLIFHKNGTPKKTSKKKTP
ncbi:sulfatase-like hydrolase/transferase [Rubritalea tangerina]|uniref:Sulfatase-like hydrolase/transferase n=2 Tax=Rubritalea tangerina TaxID=430798 RepID=A0ABW4ZG22_9BACT